MDWALATWVRRSGNGWLPVSKPERVGKSVAVPSVPAFLHLVSMYEWRPEGDHAEQQHTGNRLVTLLSG